MEQGDTVNRQAKDVGIAAGVSSDAATELGTEKAPRFRVKPEHAPFRISGGKIRIGGISYGIAAEVEDPTGAIWTLLESMNGERDVEQIVSRVLAVHPGESKAAVRNAVKTFVDSGYIEDLAAPDPEVLTEREKERYDRSQRYYRWADLKPRASTWDVQVLLRKARVTVLGIGGTGGNAALALAMSGVGQLHCVDADTVELSNLNRQVLFTEADLGRPKVIAAIERIRRHNSDIVVTGEQRRVSNRNDVQKLAEGCDVLLLCADQPSELRIWTNRACLATATPWVESGYHGPQVNFGIYVPGKGPCWECLRLTSEERYDAMGANFEDTFLLRANAVANAVAAPTAGLGGYLAAHCAISLLTGVAPVPAGHIYGVNLTALDHKLVLNFPRRPDCPACGERR